MGVADFSNLTRDGALLNPKDRVWLFKLGERLWRSDSSSRPVTAGYSPLSGRTIPPSSGDTEFADMRAAYDALDDKTKAEIEDLECEHSLTYCRKAIGVSMAISLTTTPRKCALLLNRAARRSSRRSLFQRVHEAYGRTLALALDHRSSEDERRRAFRPSRSSIESDRYSCSVRDAPFAERGSCESTGVSQ